MNAEQYNIISALNYRRALSVDEWNIIYNVYAQIKGECLCKSCPASRRQMLDYVYEQAVQFNANNLNTNTNTNEDSTDNNNPADNVLLAGKSDKETKSAKRKRSTK